MSGNEAAAAAVLAPLQPNVTHQSVSIVSLHSRLHEKKELIQWEWGCLSLFPLLHTATTCILNIGGYLRLAGSCALERIRARSAAGKAST